MKSQNHKTAQFGRDLRRALVRPPAQRRVSCGVRPGCSGLYLVASWKLSGMETAHLSGQPASPLDCPSGKEVFLLARLNISCSNLCPLPLVFPLCTTVNRLYLLHNLLLGSSGLQLSTSNAFQTLGRTSPISLASPYRTNTPAPNHLGGPLLNFLWFISIFSVLIGPKPDRVSRCSLTSAKHFLHSAGSAMVHTAQDAVGRLCCKGTLQVHAQLAVCQDS